MTSIAVIGAGIAGLTAAYRLASAGADVTVFEATDAVGGVIRSERVDGYLVEHGPNALQTRAPLLTALIDELGLHADVVEARAEARHRFVARGGRPVAVPTSPPALLRTRLVSTGAKLRLLREPFIRRAPASAEESVAGFTRRRLGWEWLDYAVDPFVAGVYAGDPERLSLRHAFPRLYALEQTHGSLLRGQIALARERRSAGDASAPVRMISFRDGLQTLPGALATRLGQRLRLQTPVQTLRPDGAGWIVRFGSSTGSEEARFDGVVLAVPLHRLAGLSLETPVDLAPLVAVYHPPVRVVALGYRRADVSHPLDGFGVLVPAAEASFRILGTLFSSSIFAGRAPEGHVLLTTFVGGARRPALGRASERDVQDATERDLGVLLGIDGPPVFARQVYWENAIPQYEVGYGGVRQTLEHLEAVHPRLRFAGSFRSGVSVGEACASGDRAARDLLGRLAQD